MTYTNQPWSFSVLLNEEAGLGYVCAVPVEGNLSKRCVTSGRGTVRKRCGLAKVLVCLLECLCRGLLNCLEKVRLLC